MESADVQVAATFLLTDIEGSTALWEQAPDAMRAVLQRHNALLAEVVDGHRGYVFKTVGDAFCVAFDRAPAAVAAAEEIQRRVAAEPWRIASPLRLRIALHTGPAHLTDGDYHGQTINRCARLLAVTRGGQTLLSAATAGEARHTLPPGAALRDVGMHRLRDVADAVHVFQLIHAGLAPDLVVSGDLADSPRANALPAVRFDPAFLTDLPTLPAVAMQVMRLMQDPDVDARTVQDSIGKDPAMAAKVLRVANSAFFGAARQVRTIGDAVRVLGFANVQGVVIGLSVFDAFRAARLDLSRFWTHSVATGIAGRHLARRAGCAPDVAFTAGVLHDIGKLIFVLHARADYAPVLDAGDGPSVALDAERRLFDFTHPEVGGLVAERWLLPSQYVDCLAHHHDLAAGGDARTLCAVVAAADRAAHAAYDVGGPPGEDAARDEALSCLGLGLPDWERSVDHLGEERAAVETFVGAMG